MNTIAKATTAALLISNLALVACAEKEQTPGMPAAGTVLSLRMADYESAGQSLAGENEITDFKACIFEEGRMTHIYDNLQASGSGYALQLDSHSGTLYVLANTGNQIDLHELQSQSLDEQSWLKQTMALDREAPVHFFTGSVKLDEMSSSQTTIPVTLKRGVARFDLQVKTAGVARIKSITMKNTAGKGLLFTSDAGSLSPEGVERAESSVRFDEPLTANTQGVMYLYEQSNEGLEVTIEAEIDGVEKSLSKAIDGDIRRNTVYTLTVRKDVIDVEVSLSFDEWEEGGDTELTPARR